MDKNLMNQQPMIVRMLYLLIKHAADAMLCLSEWQEIASKCE